MSGGGVLAALQSLGVDAIGFDPAERDLSDLKREGVARCFIALHGRHGEDGTVQGALELLGMAYTGSGVMASAVAMDKVMTKRLWLAEDLPTPRHVWLEPGALGDESAANRLRCVAAELGLPLIVKPPREGSSIGVTKVANQGDIDQKLLDAVTLATRYDADVLCEEFIAGEEVTCPVIGEGASARALPVVRIRAPEGAYDYQNKYFTDSVTSQCPSGLPEAEERAIQAASLAAFKSDAAATATVRGATVLATPPQWPGAPVGGALYVDLVGPGSAALSAGLREGDLIVEAQGRPVGSVAQFEAIAREVEGKALMLRVQAQGLTRQLRVGP